jgi:hypothetical protein
VNTIRNFPRSAFLKMLCIPLFLLVILYTTTTSYADEPPANLSEFCLPGGVEDTFKLEGALANQPHNIVVMSLSSKNSVVTEFGSGDVLPVRQNLGPSDRVTVPFTPATAEISMKIDNTANTTTSCIFAYAKEIARVSLVVDIAQQRCIGANQSIGSFITSSEASGIYKLTIQNNSTTNNLIVSDYGLGLAQAQTLSAKAGQKVVLNVSARANGTLYLRVNNLSNVTETCFEVMLTYVGKATPTVRPNATPASSVITSCVSASQQNRLIRLGSGLVGYRYTVVITNDSTDNTLAISVYSGVTVSQIYNIGPKKTTAILLTPKTSGTIYLSIDNRGNRTSSCVRAVMTRRLVSTASVTPVPGGPTPTRPSNLLTKCANAGQLTTGTVVGTVIRQKAHSILVTNLSKTNAISVSFIRGTARSKIYKVDAGKSSIITLTSTTSGTLTMNLDNRANSDSTCVVVIMTK